MHAGRAVQPDPVVYTAPFLPSPEPRHYGDLRISQVKERYASLNESSLRSHTRIAHRYPLYAIMVLYKLFSCGKQLDRSFCPITTDLGHDANNLRI